MNNQVSKTNIINKGNKRLLFAKSVEEKNHNAVECYFRYEYRDKKAYLAFVAMNTEKALQIYADSGATSHMMKDIGNFDQIIPYRGNDKIFIGNGHGLKFLILAMPSLILTIEN